VAPIRSPVCAACAATINALDDVALVLTGGAREYFWGRSSSV
jgi:hypothetical protein